MKILFIAPEIRIRGASLSLLGLAEQLLQKGHQVSVVVRKLNNEYVNDLQKVGVEIIYCKYYLWVIHGEEKPIKRFFTRSIHRLACYLNRLQAKRLAAHLSEYDIIHTNTTASDFGAYLSKYTGIPHVWHVREFGKEDFGFMPAFSESFFYKFMEKNSEKIITISRAVYNQYKRFVDPKKLCVIYNGIDQERFWNNKKIIFEDENEVSIAMTGYMSSAKGQLILLEALPEVISEVKQSVKVSLVGDADKDYREELQKAIDRLQIGDNVEFINFTNKVEEILQNCDISVICSKAEAFGRVTAEAMLAGNLVIGADSGGTTEILGDGKYGMLFENGNPISLARTLIKAISEKEKSVLLAKAGQNYAHSEFTATHNADQIISVYQNILGKT